MSPAWVDWNTCAVPEKPVVRPLGKSCMASRWTSAVASPSDTPSARLNDSVTDGNWPEWLTAPGPDDFARVWVWVAVSVWAIVAAAMIPSLVQVGRGEHPPLDRSRLAEIAPAAESGRR